MIINAASANKDQKLRLSRLLRPEGAAALVEAACDGDFDVSSLQAAVHAYERTELQFDTVLNDGSRQSLSFNVMPRREVNEEIKPKHYLVGERCARVVFDRTYRSSMEKSPTHLIFFSALLQWQKLIYLMMCRECGVAYRPEDTEIFKVWPTDVRVALPTLVREERGLRQDSVLSSRRRFPRCLSAHAPHSRNRRRVFTKRARTLEH